jgi:DNA invertase Pin-like site-specific DNA recombinase
MSGKQIGYVRVSSVDQNTERQLDGVDLDRVFEDKASGAKSENRKALQECLQYLRDGDVLHVHSIDRLARNLLELQKLVGDLVARGVVVRFHKEGMTFSGENDPMQTLMLQMLGAFAEFERAMIRERQREGIEAAKRAGKHLGRPSALTDQQIEEARARRAQGETPTQLATAFGVSRASMYAYLKEAA